MTPRYLLCYAQYCITPLPGSNEWHHNNCPWSQWSGGAVEPPPAAALPTVQTIVTPKQLCVPSSGWG